MAWEKRTGIMLCQPLDEHNLDRNFKIAPKMLVQPKLDGQRAWVQWEYSDDSPLLISSQGNIITGVPHINLALKELAKIMDRRISWDGELYSHKMGFEEIVSRTKREAGNRHPDYTSIQYHIFDIKSPVPNLERQERIWDAQNLWNIKAEPALQDIIQFVETWPASKNEIEDYLNAFVNQGYEGIIVRNPLAGYVERRPYTILKWKPSKEDYYQILEVEEAISENGHKLGKVGSLVCVDRFGNTFKVGTGVGLTDEKRFQLWRLNDLLIGKWACVQYQNLTKYGVPRFGKFTRIIISLENREEEVW